MNGAATPGSFDPPGPPLPCPTRRPRRPSMPAAVIMRGAIGRVGAGQAATPVELFACSSDFDRSLNR
jgi:hypothetical protein